jgi:signal-transduction protein with cAMP-binding, CBS, and nucleotidyltransferase domain
MGENNLNTGEGKAMTNVRHILEQKGLHVWSVPPETTILEAANMMFEKNIGALIIVDNEKVVGMFSERDIARKLMPSETPSHFVAVCEIMTPAVITVTPEQTVDECMALMTEHRIRHLPVLEDQKIVGLISIGDVIKAVILEKELLLKQSSKSNTGAQ